MALTATDERGGKSLSRLSVPGTMFNTERLHAALHGEGIERGRRALLALGCLLLAALLWLPSLRVLFRPDLQTYRLPQGIAPRARALAERHLRLWSNPALRAEELRRMRRSNAEWDFMARTYFVLALCNMALRDPASASRTLAVADRIIAETLRLEREEGFLFFLMPYARDGAFLQQPPRSLFVDGEIALMLGARRLVAERPGYQPLLAERVRLMVDRMSRGPVRCAESYPDECWTFCNTVALAAVRLADRLDGTDHRAFLALWVKTARQKLVDPSTGLLISSFRWGGRRGDGPEGSSIWMAVHMLQVVDATFAGEQYRLARDQLRRTFLGFGYSREWPPLAPGRPDIDSGAVLPLLEASPAASGLALLAAAGFDDGAYLQELLAALEFAAFPVEEQGALRFAASNPVGDAVLLYALVEGPLWARVAGAAGSSR
jgi:hypothetical protein